MSPLYLPICGIYLPFQVNLYVSNSKPSNEILFCMLEQLMFQLGLPISSMLVGLFSRGVDSAPHSRERAGNRDAQSHDPKRSKQINIIKQNSPRDVVSWRHSLFRASHGLMLVGGWGSINLYHSVWELPIMHVVWKIQPSHSCCVDSESMPLKMLFISILKSSSGTSTNPCFPPRRAYLLLSHHLLIKKHPLESTLSFVCINISLYWV